MKTTILRALRAETHAWWKHQELRAAGQIEEARKREHKSIRQNVAYLRSALANEHAHITCGRGGTSFHVGWTSLSTYAPIERFAVAWIGIALGIPFIDTRTVKDPIKIIDLPLVAHDGRPEKKPWHSMSRVPLRTYMEMSETIGATITNKPLQGAAE